MSQYEIEIRNRLRDAYPDHYKVIDSYPEDIRHRIGYGMYGFVEQYFIWDVDGRFACLGKNIIGTPLENHDNMREEIREAGRQYREIMKERGIL